MLSNKQGKGRGGGSRGGGGGQRGGRKSKQPLHQINVDDNTSNVQQSDRQRLFSEASDDQCSVCWNDIKIFAIGFCNHPICYICSTRMRVLCSQKDCPICRQDLSKVVFIRKLCSYQSVADQVLLQDKRYQICFEDQEVKKSYDNLLAHNCPLCPPEKNVAFKTFKQLDTHLRREHEKFFCELCNQHLKKFSHERKFYSRSELATHRRKGDPDDSSHRGHPLCQFCEVRFVDDEELFRHLRRDHYFCHFCDADGVQAYYPDYGLLKAHFKQAHFLCEEGDCIDEQFTHAFRTELDLKAHRLERHKLSKVESKLNRQVGIDVSFVSRRPNHHRGHGHGPYEEDQTAVERVPDMTEDFPSLGGGGAAQSRPAGQSSKSTGNMANRLASSSGRNWASASHASAAFQETDFPSLPGAPPAASAPAAGATAKPPSQKVKKVIPKQTRNNPSQDFPSLPSSSQSQVHSFGPQYRYPSGHTPAWQSESPRPKTNEQSREKGKKVAPAPDLDFPSLQPSRQPSLNKVKKSKKKASEPPSQPTTPTPPTSSSLRSAADLIFCATNGRSDCTPCAAASVEMKENVPKVNVVKQLPTVQPKKPPPGFANRGLDHSKAKVSHSKNFIRPSDFNERNAKLMSAIVSAFGGGKSLEFSRFKELSHQYKEDQIDSSTYLANCNALLSNDVGKLESFMADLIVLLPQIRKQQQLFNAFVAKFPGSKALSSLQSCDKCDQILKRSDITEHNRLCIMDLDFPAL